MKTTTALFIDKYHPKADHTCAISLRVTHERKKKYYQTGISLTVSDFEKAMGARPRNELKELALKLYSVEQRANDILNKLPAFSWSTFERKFLSFKSNNEYLFNHFEDYSDKLKKENRIGSSQVYSKAGICFQKFKPSARITDVNVEYLKRFESWMLAKGRSITSVSIYTILLRSIVNMAIENGEFNKEDYPFGKRKFEVPKGNNIKKALPLSEIAKIYNYVSAEESTQKAKDMWLFMYLCNGLNIKDVCRLKYSDIQDGFIIFIRAKTALTKRVVQPIRVPYTEDLKNIIKKWGNKNTDSYIFDILHSKIDAQTEHDLIYAATTRINFHLKKIALELDIPGTLTTYTARHSFATVLQRSNVSTAFISEALGHSSLSTTQNYLAGFEDESKREVSKVLTAFKKQSNEESIAHQ